MINKKSNILLIIVFALLLIFIIFFVLRKNSVELIIDEENIIIELGENKKINAYVKNDSNAKIYLESNNEEIVTVNDDEIMGVNTGETNVTVSYYHNDKKYEKTCFVTVIEGDNKKLISMKFPEGDIVMGLDSLFVLYGYVVRKPLNGYVSDIETISSNTSVVDVNDNGIYCRKEGMANVKLILNNNIEDNIDVYCVDGIEKAYTIINPESIKIIDENIKMVIGEEKKIAFTVSPDGASMEYMKYTSSNEKVASVSKDGVIKANDTGKTIITIKSLTGISASVVVNVGIKAEKINIDKDNIELLMGESYVLKPSIYPIDASNNTFTFTTSNNQIVSLEPSLDNKEVSIKGLTAGNAIINIKNADGIEKNVNVVVSNSREVIPNITSTGEIDNGLLGSPSNNGFESCRSVSPHLTLKINGTTIGQDGGVSVHVGDTFKVSVYLPTKCGEILRLTRNTPSGGDNWREFVKQESVPRADTDNGTVYYDGMKEYTWTITALKKGYLKISQTAQFDVKAPNGTTGNIKSMIRLAVRILD